jgi:hypothetical protein
MVPGLRNETWETRLVNEPSVTTIWEQGLELSWVLERELPWTLVLLFWVRELLFWGLVQLLWE